MCPDFLSCVLAKQVRRPDWTGAPPKNAATYSVLSSSRSMDLRRGPNSAQNEQKTAETLEWFHPEISQIHPSENSIVSTIQSIKI